MNIEKIRKESKKSQRDIAKILGMTQPCYANYETGKTEPRISSLIKLADYYDVSLDYLVGRTYNDNIGYIEKADKETIKLFLTLNELNKVKVASFIAGLLAVQN